MSVHFITILYDLLLFYMISREIFSFTISICLSRKTSKSPPSPYAVMSDQVVRRLLVIMPPKVCWRNFRCANLQIWRRSLAIRHRSVQQRDNYRNVPRYWCVVADCSGIFLSFFVGGVFMLICWRCGPGRVCVLASLADSTEETLHFTTRSDSAYSTAYWSIQS